MNTEGVEIRNRVTEVLDVPGNLVLPNPMNWRTHPESQTSALRGILSSVGVVDVLKVVKHPKVSGSYMLIDGHARAEILGDRNVKVAVLDLTPEEQRLILATFDPVGGLAGTDQAMLDSLIDGLSVEDTALLSLLEGIHSFDPGETPDLGSVEEEHGKEPDVRLSWPWVKIQLPPDVYADWCQALSDTKEKDPVEQVRVLVSQVLSGGVEF